jgi:hypothetical protein
MSSCSSRYKPETWYRCRRGEMEQMTPRQLTEELHARRHQLYQHAQRENERWCDLKRTELLGERQQLIDKEPIKLVVTRTNKTLLGGCEYKVKARHHYCYVTATSADEAEKKAREYWAGCNQIGGRDA